MAEFKEAGGNRTSTHNHGCEHSSAADGQKVMMDYGLDRSSMTGSKKNERGDTLAGSTTDLSHSLSGVKAQHGVSKRGRDSGLN